MPQPPATASATAAAAASPTPGGGAPILAAWLLVRRRAFLTFAKRRYVVITDDHVLLVDNTPVLHLVDCRVTTHPSSKIIDLTPAPQAGLPVRIFADSPFQYSKWRLALQTTSHAAIHHFYRIDTQNLVGVGVHGIVRAAVPYHPPRDHSLESSNAPSDYSLHPSPSPPSVLHPTNSTSAAAARAKSRGRPRLRDRGRQPETHPTPIPNPASAITNIVVASRDDDVASPAPGSPATTTSSTPSPSANELGTPSRDSRDRSRDRSRDHAHARRLFKRRVVSTPAIDRNSVDIDPDARSPNPPPDAPVPSSHLDKRYLRQPTPLAQILTPVPTHALHHPLATHAQQPGGHRTPVAVKTISRTGHGTVTVASELLFAKSRLNHFAIIKVLDLFQSVADIHVVMEYCMGGSLSHYVQEHGPLNETDAKLIFAPVLKAVGYLHASGLAHWDVNPANIMFFTPAPPFEPKLIDFGTARPIDPSNGRVPHQFPVFSEKGKVASLSCASPELLTSKAHRYAAKADMWQLGCVLYFVLVGKLPFSKRSHQDVAVSSTIMSFCKKRTPERRQFLFDQDVIGNVQVSNEAKELILKLLCPNPRMRPNALQCLKEFSFLASGK